ncbi:MAG: hypothetical protein V4564_07870, partial [Pseudomonadota bacterium]
MSVVGSVTISAFSFGAAASFGAAFFAAIDALVEPFGRPAFGRYPPRGISKNSGQIKVGLNDNPSKTAGKNQTGMDFVQMV